MTPQQMIATVKKLAEGPVLRRHLDGLSRPVRHNKPVLDPMNLGKGWAGFDFAAQFGKPVKVVNDALMQAIGSYEGGPHAVPRPRNRPRRGDGLRQCRPADGARPSSLQERQEFRGTMSASAAWKSAAKKKWRGYVFDVVNRLRAALQPDYVVIGGGNVDKLDELPADSRRGDNTRAFEGGFRLWARQGLDRLILLQLV